MKIEKQMIIKDGLSIANVIDRAISESKSWSMDENKYKSLYASMKTLSNLLKETKLED